jgi:hypothetical protein
LESWLNPGESNRSESGRSSKRNREQIRPIEDLGLVLKNAFKRRKNEKDEKDRKDKSREREKNQTRLLDTAFRNEE